MQSINWIDANSEAILHPGSGRTPRMRPGSRGRRHPRRCDHHGRDACAAPSRSTTEQEMRHERSEETDHQRGLSRRRQPERDDRRPARPAAAAGCLVPGEARPLRPRGDPRAAHARQGLRRLRHVHRHARHHEVHAGEDLLPGRQEDRAVRPLHHRRRRARRGRCRARHPRLRGQVLHRGRQLGHGRQQHAGVLPARPAQVPRPQPRGQARPAHQPAQREEQLGLLDLAAGGPAPDHHRHERPRHPGDLPPHARLRQPHLQLHQREERAPLGQVPLQVASRASGT